MIEEHEVTTWGIEAQFNNQDSKKKKKEKLKKKRGA